MNAPPADLVDNFTTNDARVGLHATGSALANAPEKKEIVTKGPEKENMV